MIVQITMLLSVVLLIIGSKLFVTASGVFADKQDTIGLIFYTIGATLGVIVFI